MLHVAHREAHEDLLKQLNERLESRLDNEKANKVKAFARDFYNSMPIEDLSERDLDEVYGATLSVWHFLQQFDKQVPKVRMNNPEFEEHGWQSAHNFIVVLHQDMPFLVDSVRVELNRRGMTVHAIHNTVLNVERDTSHQLIRVLAVGEDRGQSTQESLIVIEVDHHSDASEIADVERSLQDVLNDVRTAVSDYEPMVSKVHDTIAELRAHCPPQVDAKDHQEAIDFFEWLLDDNFTFFGYDEYEVLPGNGSQRLGKFEDSELGTFRLNQPRYRETIRTDHGVEGGSFVLMPKLLSFAKSA